MNREELFEQLEFECKLLEIDSTIFTTQKRLIIDKATLNLNYSREANNDFTVIPKSLDELIDNIYIQVYPPDHSAHRIKIKIPDDIFHFTNLKNLDIKDVDAEIPHDIRNLKNLRILSIWNNFSLYSLPESIGELTKLEEIHLHQIPLTRLPDSIGDLYNLKKLHLNRVPLTNLPDDISELHNLIELILRCNLDRLTKGICQLENLERLDLGGNSISSLPVSIGNLINLISINLAGNGIKELPNLKNLKKLEKLWISEPELTCLPEDIGELTNLTHLQIQGTKIRKLPKSIEKLKALTFLRIRSNKIYPKYNPEWIYDLPNIITIDID